MAVTSVGNDDEDENVDVEGDSETTMYDIVYGGNGGWPSQQQHNRMRQQSMILHGGGYNRGESNVSFPCLFIFFFNTLKGLVDVAVGQD